MRPGTAAGVPTKQERDDRLQPGRRSFPASIHRCQLTTLAAVFSGEPPATLHAAKNIQTARDIRRDFQAARQRRRRAPREAANFFSRAHLFQICGVGADGGATARPVLPRP